MILLPSDQTTKKPFSQRFIISYQENVWPRSDSFLGHTKMFSRKYCSTSCYSRRVWHKTLFIHGNQDSQHPEKHNKQPENWKQISQWMVEDKI